MVPTSLGNIYICRKKHYYRNWWRGLNMVLAVIRLPTGTLLTAERREAFDGFRGWLLYLDRHR